MGAYSYTGALDGFDPSRCTGGGCCSDCAVPVGKVCGYDIYDDDPHEDCGAGERAERVAS